MKNKDILSGVVVVFLIFAVWIYAYSDNILYAIWSFVFNLMVLITTVYRFLVFTGNRVYKINQKIFTSIAIFRYVTTFALGFGLLSLSGFESSPGRTALIAIYSPPIGIMIIGWFAALFFESRARTEEGFYNTIEVLNLLNVSVMVLAVVLLGALISPIYLEAGENLGWQYILVFSGYVVLVIFQCFFGAQKIEIATLIVFLSTTVISCISYAIWAAAFVGLFSAIAVHILIRGFSHQSVKGS